MAEMQQGFDTGVRKYFYFIKEEVSSDWKDLAFHLDFRRSDIDNITGRNRDDKSRCMDLLEEWLKRNGERATIEVLMEALSEAELQSTVDGLKNKYPDLKTPQVLSSQQDIEDVFRKAVKKYYELKLTSFKPLIWNDNFTLNLGDIFTQLELVPKDEKQPKRSEGDYRSGEIKQINSLDDLFNPDITGLTTAPRCILIEGEAGGGKTTFLSKEALDAVSKKTELGKRHDMVLLIRLRDVREGETIAEMVLDQCVPITKGVDIESIGGILDRNQSRVLFLLDGYDELRPEARAAGQAIPELLSGKLYPYSTIVITSRPSAGVQQYTIPNCQVRIMGFTRRHVEKYVRQYFSTIQVPELGERLTTALNWNQIVADLVRTPIFLLLICVLWEEDQEMISTGTMTGLYNNLLTCLLRKFCKREGVDMPLDGLPTKAAESLLQLGKLALEALLRNETLIALAQLESDTFNWELLVKLGVVTLEVSASKWHPRKQLNFSHKTMQEFLAGRYVAHVVGNQSGGDIAELLQLTSVHKAHELSNLLKFTCGCGSRAAQAVMEELGKISRKEFSHLQPSDFDQSHMPVRSEIEKSTENYERFVLLCLDILNERKEPDVLQAVSKALPFIIMVFWGQFRGHDKLSAALKCYLETTQSSNIQNKVILTLNGKEGLQYLQQIFSIHIRSSHLQVKLSLSKKDDFEYLQQLFASPILGLQVDLKLLGDVKLGTPNQTTRLVSVLMNVPGMRALDLSHTELTPSSLQVLVQGFCHIPLLEELELSSNHALGDEGMEVLQFGLPSVPHLTVLRLRAVGMTAVGMKSMAPYMRHLAGLKELDITDNNIGDSGLESLIPVLSIFTTMQVLVLEETGISATGMRKLVPVLCQLSRLIKLDISGNQDIGDIGLEYLADILPRLIRMKVLYLHVTCISDRGIPSLIKALPHLVQLQVLDVSRNEIGDSGIVSLVETLCQPSNLDMEHNPPGDKSLTTAPQYNTTLQQLRFGLNREVTGAGLARVAQLISALPTLTWLDMSGYPPPAHLSDTAAMALAEALPRLPALEELDLLYISMEHAGFQAVVQAAEEHPALRTLRFIEKRVPEGADTSASCLRLSSW
ncbi:NLR family CARD domain-containing protein 4-like [Branchiostoma floridae]|uniref:NLR family CARD domain-containing protein 4-like n=1 Tax=Branchiostoma floridae TaxID=7739 RepID=A0A9J7L6A9_BRAFL|nr:NLR family CARD domain-containing protein 4-like [Branchiostoma floridae]